MALLFAASGFVASLYILIKSSSFLVDVLSSLARLLKISEFAVGFIFVAVATSLPEFSVGISSSLEKVPTLTLGNVIGTAPVNLGLILGLSALLSNGIRAHPHVLKKDALPMVLASLVPLVFLLDGQITRNEGLALLFFFALYIAHTYLTAREYVKSSLAKDSPKDKLSTILFKFLVGAALLLGSADVMVRFSKVIVEESGFSFALFGLIVVAFGTSLPELAFAIQAAFKKAGGLVLGELMGSSVTNATLILGTTSLIHPIQINFANAPIYILASGFYLASLSLFILFLWTQYQINQKEGVLLILFYIVFLIAQFVFL